MAEFATATATAVEAAVGTTTAAAAAPTVAVEPDRNQALLQAVKDEYAKINFRYSDMYTRPQIGSRLDDFATSVSKLLVACRSNPALCDEVTKLYITEHLVTVTDVLHSDHYCDSVCLELLALLAKTESGASYLHNHCLRQITRWANPTSRAAFPSASVPVLRNVQDTIARKEARLQETAQQLGKETLATLDLEHTQMGILLYTTRDGIRRRVRALPQLYADLPRAKFCHIFSEGCPGCIGLNLICAAEVLNDSRLVWTVVKDMLNDPPGEILKIGKLDALRKSTRESYQRREDPYPFMGNCIDFGMDTPVVKAAKELGELISSSSFASAMKRDRAKCIKYATAKLKGKAKESIEDFCKTV